MLPHYERAAIAEGLGQPFAFGSVVGDAAKPKVDTERSEERAVFWSIGLSSGF